MKPINNNLFIILATLTISTTMLASSSDKMSYETVSHTARVISRGNLTDWSLEIAKFESANNHKVINQYGMMGKYQFSKNTLKGLGITDYDRFMRDEQLQEVAMRRNIRSNYQQLKPIIDRFEGTTHRGVYITRSGILAGAHLVGVGGVKTFFYPSRFHHITEDANGVNITDYLTKFGGYDITYYGG